MGTSAVPLHIQFRLGWRLVRQGYAWRDLGNVVRYGWQNAPRTFERIWIDPKSVRFYVVDTGFSRADSGRVIGGEWDRVLEPFDQQYKVKACRQHFLENVSWEETGVYDMMLDRIAERGVFDGCRNRDDVVKRYQDIDRLHESLAREEGVKTQQQLHPKTLREKGGIHIHISRAGEPLFAGGGFHRLAIARLIGLPRIPAQLGVVHEQAVANGVMPRLRRERD